MGPGLRQDDSCDYSNPCAFGISCVGSTVGAGLAWVWPIVAVVVGPASTGFACVTASCVDSAGAGFAASTAGFAGSGAFAASVTGLAGSAGFAASGLGFGT